MTTIGDLAAIGKPILYAVANVLAALEEREAGGSGHARFLQAGGDLFEAVSRAAPALSRATSGGRALTPVRPTGMNLSGHWHGEPGSGMERAFVEIAHSSTTGLMALLDGPEAYYGGTDLTSSGNTMFVVTQGNKLWHGVGSARFMSTTLWIWDSGDNKTFNLVPA
ncbi:MAG TPA: hypothetical protein VIH71_15805 [Solirubrobacteraceae bacterium]